MHIGWSTLCHIPPFSKDYTLQVNPIHYWRCSSVGPAGMPAADDGAEASTPLSAALARIDARNRPITAYSDCGDQARENSTHAFVSSIFLNATPGKLASAWLCCASVTPKPVATRLKTVCLLADMGCSGIPAPIIEA